MEPIAHTYSSKSKDKITEESFGSSIGRKFKVAGSHIYVALHILKIVAFFPIYALSGCNWDKYRDLVWEVFDKSWGYGVKWNLFEFSVFLTEPVPCLKSGLDDLGIFCGESIMNPDSITPAQALKQPILLIPGSHGQSKYLASIARKLSQANLGPIFAVDTMNPGRTISQRDLAAVYNKIDEIKGMYSRLGIDNPQINVIGYSRGALISQYLAIDRTAWKMQGEGMEIELLKVSNKISPNAVAKDIGKCIQIGFPVKDWLERSLPEEILVKHFDIDGSQDRIVTERSNLQPSHRYLANCGHAGLLHDDQVAAKLIEILA